MGRDIEDLKDFEIGNPLSEEIRIFGGNQKWDFWPQEKHRATLNAVQRNHLEYLYHYITNIDLHFLH